jgi:cobalt-zinc-cadmium efflux system protein
MQSSQNNHSHDDHQAHDHQHAHASENPFSLPFFLILIFAVIELAGGIWTNSLALLGDAWHMFSDVFALGLAWFASHHAGRSKKHKSGQSYIEIMASIINALLMLVVVIYIILEAIDRFKNPHVVTGGYVMLIAFVGLIVNVIVAKLLHDDDGDQHHSHAHNHNKRAAFLHVLGDLLGSIAALVAGAVIYFTGWLAIDSILSIFISLLILVVTLKLIKDIWKAFQT